MKKLFRRTARVCPESSSVTTTKDEAGEDEVFQTAKCSCEDCLELMKQGKTKATVPIYNYDIEVPPILPKEKDKATFLANLSIFQHTVDEVQKHGKLPGPERAFKSLFPRIDIKKRDQGMTSSKKPVGSVSPKSLDKKLVPVDPTKTESYKLDIVRAFTYVKAGEKDWKEQDIDDMAMICKFLVDEDLDLLMADDDNLKGDFLRKICLLFVISWRALMDNHELARRTAWGFRRVLIYVIKVPGFATKACDLFTSSVYWPNKNISPLSILNDVCQQQLFCYETLSLLCNITRIPGFVQVLHSWPSCLEIIKRKFYDICCKIREGNELGVLLLNLLVNLTLLGDFASFIVEADSGLMIQDVFPEVLLQMNLGKMPNMQIAVWPFLKNLCLMEEGRKAVMNNIENYIGHILYPIAGPEQLTDEEMECLPLEVKFLPKTKKRAEEHQIREYVLDIVYLLCRYKDDREVLRKWDIYQIFKYYHLAEEDELLNNKIEDVVNVLIRKEGSEIEVDDLMDGLSIKNANSNIKEGESEGDQLQAESLGTTPD